MSVTLTPELSKKEKRRVYAREYYRKNTKNIRACQRKYQENNTEKQRAYKRKYWIKNKDKINAQRRDSYSKNKDIREYYQNYQYKHRARIRKSYQKNREKRIQHLRAYRSLYPEKGRTAVKRYHDEHRAEINMQTRNYSRQLRLELMDILGGRSCAECGYSDVRALHIDHINSDGNKHRKIKSNLSYRFYINNQEQAKATLQILCANCNNIKAYDYLQERMKVRRSKT